VDVKNDKYWTNKYKPRKIKEIFGCKEQTKAIVEWLDNFDSMAKKNRGKSKKKNIVIKEEKLEDSNEIDEINEMDEIDEIVLPIVATNKKQTKDKSCLIVTGDHGTGKTSIVQCILMSKKYDIYMVDFSKISKMKETKKEPKKGGKTPKAKAKDNKDPGKVLMNDFIEKTMKGVNIYDTITGAKKKKMAIIIDELESIISPVERNFITSVLKQNDSDWVCPIIFIANNHHSKIINAVKTNSYEIKLSKPLVSDMENLLMMICFMEKICLENPELNNKIIEHSQHDYRKLIMMLQDIKELYAGKVFTHSDFIEYSDLAKMKDIDAGIFGTTNILMYGYKNISDTMRLYETDKVLIPLMVQQNYVSTLNGNYNCGDKEHIAKQISESLAEADVVENYIYGNQNWELQEVHGFLSCTYPSYIMTKNLNPKNESVENKFGFYSFPVDLNRTSIKKINFTKNIVNAHKFFKNMNIDDYIYLNKVIKGLIAIGNTDECNELFDGYKCTKSVIESVVKIDKIMGTKYNIPAGIKKKLRVVEE
jgi:hypothetical protein